MLMNTLPGSTVFWLMVPPLVMLVVTIFFCLKNWGRSK